MGKFSFHWSKIKLLLAHCFKNMLRSSGISSLETNLVWFSHLHSPILPCTLVPCIPDSKLEILHYSSISHKRIAPKSETALIHQEPSLDNLHWTTINVPIPLVKNLFHRLWEHFYRLGKAWMRFLEVQQITPHYSLLLQTQVLLENIEALEVWKERWIK